MLRNSLNIVVDYFSIVGDILGIYPLLGFIRKLYFLLLVYLTPVQYMATVLVILITVDFCTGVLAAKARGELISSYKISKTASKIVVYITLVLLSHMITDSFLLGDAIPLSAIVSSYLALTELKSVLENMNDLTYNQVPILRILLNILSNDQFRSLCGNKYIETINTNDKKKSVKRVRKTKEKRGNSKK